MKISIIGSGSWGTALAILLVRNGHTVTLLGRDAAEVSEMRTEGTNSRYLPGVSLPSGIMPQMIGRQMLAPDMTVIAVPSHAVRAVVSELKGHAQLVVVSSKGLEPETAKLMTEVVLDQAPNAHVGAISGPNLATEIVQGVPTVAVAAYLNPDVAAIVADAFSGPAFRVSTTNDIVGVEIGGALKNVLAIGAGMSDGLGFGDNTKGALLSRGLMEMARLSNAMGGRPETLLGPAGVGDLFATAVSKLSRNYRVGRLLGSGAKLPAALAEVGQVAEGVPTSSAAMLLARRYEVEMPVFTAVDAVIHGRLEPQRAVGLLMERSRN